MNYIEQISSELQNWNSITQKNAIHTGIFNDRLVEFKNWLKIIPLTTLYRYDEKELILSFSDKYIMTKVFIAALVLIVDDIVDNSTPAIIDVLDTNLSNIGKQVTIYCNKTLHDNGIDIINRLFELGKSSVASSDDFDFEEVINYFFKQVSLENKTIVEILLGVRCSFNQRLLCSGTQAASTSIKVDSHRLNVIDSPLIDELGLNLDSLLAYKNSIGTTESEVRSGEITSPLYLLACEITGSQPIDKTGDIEWYLEVSSLVQFKTKLHEKKVELYTSIPPILQALNLDCARFIDSLSLII